MARVSTKKVAYSPAARVAEYDAAMEIAKLLFVSTRNTPSKDGFLTRRRHEAAATVLDALPQIRKILQQDQRRPRT